MASLSKRSPRVARTPSVKFKRTAAPRAAAAKARPVVVIKPIAVTTKVRSGPRALAGPARRGPSCRYNATEHGWFMYYPGSGWDLTQPCSPDA